MRQGHIRMAFLVATALGGTAEAQRPTPPPVEQLAADCGAPTYASDTLVCGDRDLRTRDSAMRRRLGRLDRDLIRGRPPLLESQSEWFRRRNRCAFERDGRDCLSGAYAERISVINGIDMVPDRSMQTFVCEAPFLRNGRGWLTRDALFLVRDGSRMAAIALPRPRAGWRPYASWTRRDRMVTVQGQTGARITCSAVGRPQPRAGLLNEDVAAR